jgi:hypothetical protein
MLLQNQGSQRIISAGFAVMERFLHRNSGMPGWSILQHLKSSNVNGFHGRKHMEQEARNEALKLVAQAIEILESPEMVQVEKDFAVSLLKAVIDKLAI